MIILGLSAATNSLNESTETTILDEISAPQEVILPLSSLNEPGFQEDQFTPIQHCLLEYHTCAILDDGSVLLGAWILWPIRPGTSTEYTPTPTSSLEQVVLV